MKKITLIAAFVTLCSFNVFAQKAKTVNVPLIKGDNPGELLGNAKSIGTTVFVVKIKKGKCFEATSVIGSNNSKMRGQYYTKNANGSIDENSLTQGSGIHTNNFDGCANEQDEIFYFKITEQPRAKFAFAILVKNGESIK